MGAELKLWRTEVALPLTGLKANVCESRDAFGHSKKEWTALLDQLLVAYCIPYVIVLSASSKPAARHLQSSPWLQFFLSPQHLEYHCHYLCCSVARLYLTLQDSSWTGACQASLSFTISQSLFKFMSTESVTLSNHLILCHPLLLLPSVFAFALPTWIIQANLLSREWMIRKFFICYIYSPLYKLTYLKVLVIRMWTAFSDHYSAYYKGFSWCI